MKGIKAVLAGFVFCLTAGLVFSTDVHAEEFENRPYTGMDEYGNVYEMEPEAGIVDESDSIMTYANDLDKVVNFNTKGSTATTGYTEAYTGTAGYTNGGYGADAAYLGEENGQVKFMLSGVVGYVSAGEVQVINRTSANSLSHYIVSGGWLLHNITYNMERTGYAGSLKVGKAPSYLSEGTQYYSYDGHYFYIDYSVMLEDYKNEHRNQAVNASSPYFNYFQYLPMRSLSQYLGGELDNSINSSLEGMGKGNANSKLRGTGSSMISNQDTYGVNALLMLSVAANESAWGMSNIAQQKNNLFGLNAVDTSPGLSADTYTDANHCIMNFAKTYMSKGYLNPSDWRYFGGFLGNKGSGINVKYASDPYWGEKAASIAWNLDEKMGAEDQFVYTIGIKDILPTFHNIYDIRSESYAGAPVVYKSGSQSASAYIILNTELEGDFYRIQSDALMNTDGAAGIYNFDTMQAFIPSSSLSIVNQGIPLSGVAAFRDVSKGGWYYEYVDYMYNRGIMTGLNSRMFGVDENLVRAQFATIIHRLSGSPEVGYEAVFPDVPQGTFYTTAAIWAHKNDIITGYTSDGRFGGGDDITREQMATILFRYAQKKGLDTSQRADYGSFPDAGNIQDFARDAMQWAVAVGVIKGDQGNLNPQGTASRVHCAAMTTRFMKYYNL